MHVYIYYVYKDVFRKHIYPSLYKENLLKLYTLKYTVIWGVSEKTNLKINCFVYRIK